MVQRENTASSSILAKGVRHGKGKGGQESTKEGMCQVWEKATSFPEKRIVSYSRVQTKQKGVEMKEDEKGDVCLLDVVDRMQHEISMVEFLQVKAADPELEGWCAVLSERMRMTKSMLHYIVQSTEVP